MQWCCELIIPANQITFEKKSDAYKTTGKNSKRRQTSKSGQLDTTNFIYFTHEAIHSYGKLVLGFKVPTLKPKLHSFIFLWRKKMAKKHGQ